MSRQALEVADIFRAHGKHWRESHAGHVSLPQLKVMSAIERCRTQALGGHVLHCNSCEKTQISYNSCRDRHCPKCQAKTAKNWLEARQTELLPVDYYHLVFTIPSQISSLAYYNKAIIYKILLQASAQTLTTIAANPKHLGARIGATLVLHTWGSAMTHHPHVHGIVPGGGLSADGKYWVACKSKFFIHVKVLSRRFKRVFSDKLIQAYLDDELLFFGEHKHLKDKRNFFKWINPLRDIEWVVHARRPFAGPKAVLAYLSRYTHRVAIANSRLLSFDGNNVTFKWKDYRSKLEKRYKTMTLSCDEFIRRFLLHVLPKGFHRIRHYGLIANAGRKDNLAKARELLDVPEAELVVPDECCNDDGNAQDAIFFCRGCGSSMEVIEVLLRNPLPRAPPFISGGVE